MTLTYIAQQATIYAGIFLLITGTLGNLIVILIFSSKHKYRQTPSTFYFLIGSIHNILYILINLIIRLINTIYGIDLNSRWLVFCWIQSFLIGYLGLTSFTCSCLATIDQFFATSRHVYLRRFSNIKWTHRIIFIVIIIWCFHGIPVFLFYNIPPVTIKCSSANPNYATYIPIYILVLQCAIPVFIMIVFGSLTYRNIHSTRTVADRQVTKMILMQVILVIISMTPEGVYVAYNLITSGIYKSVDRKTKESFAGTIFLLISYLYYVGNFYVFFISSSAFRKSIKEKICCWTRQTQVHPFDIQQHGNQPQMTKHVQSIQKININEPFIFYFNQK